ncbi:MAG: MgtC/SapB family protein [Terriglobia bacterium]
MLMNLYGWLPPEGVKIVLVLLLSFMIGLEREEHKAVASRYTFGGVRTFPLIGLIGYSLALLSGNQTVPIGLGFLALAGFLCLSYWHKLKSADAAGVTTEISALATYLLGALVYDGHFWIATTLGVACVLLLELKTALESLTQRFPPEEILTFTKFLLLTAVILPVLPNKDFTAFNLNPFKTWLVVVAVSAISYISYILQKVTKG